MHTFLLMKQRIIKSETVWREYNYIISKVDDYYDFLKKYHSQIYKFEVI